MTERKAKSTPTIKSTSDYEPGFPKRSRIYDFETMAVEKEMRKHDRVIVQGMAYMNYISADALETFQVKQKDSRKICLNLLASNNRIPYIDACIMSLMAGQSPTSLNEYMKVNLIYTERREGYVEYPHMKDKLAKLPFVEFYNLSSTPPSFNRDYIFALRLCLESDLPWCLIVEEDAIFPRHFVEYVEKFVIEPLQDRMDELSVVSLYSEYNFGPTRLDLPQYSRHEYDKDRAKGNAERKKLNLGKYDPSFEVRRKDRDRDVVALLYPMQAVEKLITYIEEKANTDVEYLINNANEFPHYMGSPRFQVEPSLINHIGFYGRPMRDAVTKRGKFPSLSTDVRFQFDAQDIN